MFLEFREGGIVVSRGLTDSLWYNHRWVVNMSNRQEHIYSGIIASMAVATVTTRGLPPAQAFAEALGLAVGGGCGGRLPDMIEPAHHPNHRHFAHSVTLGTGMSLALASYGPQVRDALREAGTELLEWQAEYAEGTCQWYGLGILGLLMFVMSGFVIGVPVGYISHLGLDQVKSKRGLPVLV